MNAAQTQRNFVKIAKLTGQVECLRATVRKQDEHITRLQRRQDLIRQICEEGGEITQIQQLFQ